MRGQKRRSKAGTAETLLRDGSLLVATAMKSLPGHEARQTLERLIAEDGYGTRVRGCRSAQLSLRAFYLRLAELRTTSLGSWFSKPAYSRAMHLDLPGFFVRFRGASLHSRVGSFHEYGSTGRTYGL